MKFGFIALIGIVLLASQVGAQEKPVLKNQKEKVSYIIGVNIGTNFKNQAIDVDPDILAQGLKDGISGAKPLLSAQEVQEIMGAFEKNNRR